VTHLSHGEMVEKWHDVERRIELGALKFFTCWGRLYELEAGLNAKRNKARINDFGTLQLISDWKHSSIYYIGTTNATQSRISSIGNFLNCTYNH
jgi:hypothetical protein